MKYLNKQVGTTGEKISINFLVNNGYSIIMENFFSPLGEIDIIAIKDNYLCFIEVKTRYNMKYGLPIESITLKKQKRIISTAKYFICQNNLHNFYCRFDAIEVIFTPNSNTPSINHIKNLFLT